MGVITDYKISGNDLFLIEDLYWTFTPLRKDQVQVWCLIDVLKSDLDLDKLEELKNYEETVEFEKTIEIDKKTTVKIYCDSTDKEFVFKCDKIEVSKRPYNEEELTDIILKQQKAWQEDTDTIQKQREHIDNIISILSRQIESKLQVIEQKKDNPESLGFMKAKIQLQTLKEIYNRLLIDSE